MVITVLVVVIMIIVHLGGLVLGQASSALGAVQLQMKWQISSCFKALKNHVEGELGQTASDRWAGEKREVTAAGTGKVHLSTSRLTAVTEVVSGRITRYIHGSSGGTCPGIRANTGEGIKCWFKV